MKRILFLTALVLLPFFLVSGAEPDPFTFRGGILFLGSAEDDGAPSLLLNSAGVSYPIRFSDHILIEPALQVYGTWYGYPGSSDRPVPVEDAWREVWVLSLLVDPAFRAEMPVSEVLDIGLSASPGFLLRFPTVGPGADSFDESAALRYFFSQGRFFYPKTGLFLAWRATDKVSLRLQADAWFPLFHAWDGGVQPFWDEFIVSGWIGISFSAD